MLARDGRTIAIAAPTPAIARGIEGGGVTITCERPGFATTTVPLATEPASGSFFAYSGAFPERVDIALAPAPPPP
ncbi:MAG TPA: hypothetical protein VME41_17910 [Stellaceae bacterium]|nr:hypothetical protein [Stellaceae bacterium]